MAMDNPFDEDREFALLEAERLRELGNIEQEQGHYSVALPCYEEARVLYGMHGDRAGEGKTLGNLGSVYMALGQYPRAIEHYRRSLDILNAVGDEHHQGIVLGNLGLVYRTQGHYDLAIQHYTRALQLLNQAGNQRQAGAYLGNLGLVYHAQGRFDRAIEALTEAVEMHRAVGDKRSECVHLGNLGNALYRLERVDEAEKALRQAIDMGDPVVPAASGAFRGSLSLILIQTGRSDEALAMLEVGESQVASMPEEYARFLCKKVRVLHGLGQVNRARLALNQANEIAEALQVGGDSELGHSVANLAILLKTPVVGEDGNARRSGR